MLEGFRSSPLGRRISRAMLDADAWVNSSLFTGGEKLGQAYENFSSFMDRFRVVGGKKFAVEIACEGLTLGLGGAILALFLAIPAFRETSDDWLKKQELAVTFLDRYGQDVGRRGIRHNDSVPLEQLPANFVNAALATEDRRFYDHFGIDIIGTMRAITVNARSSGVVQGGSSITQQLAKNLFLSNERTIDRKIKEAFLALWLESHLTKREILKLYLDRAYMGGGTFGVQAAAEFYFDKNVKDLTLAESAMMAGLFKAPTKYAPHINLPAARARANDVLSNLVDAGYLTQAQIYAAQRNPATPVNRRRDSTPDWYLDYAYDEVKKLVDAGKLGNDRVLVVKTGLDLNIQRRAESVIEDQLRQYGPSYRAKQSAAVVIETNGAIRAIVGGRDYGASQFNRATDAMRQPGSSFKPFVYLTALNSGKFRPNTIVTDSPICLGNWCPKNYGGSFAGSLPLSSALARSLNTVAVKLSVAVGDGNAKAGRAKIIDNAKRMGIRSPLVDTQSLPLGASEVTVVDMASAYSVFANGGKRINSYTSVEINNSHGDAIYRFDRDGPQPQQLFHPNIMADMNSMLVKVTEEGTGRRALLPNTRVGGKTGTTNGYKDAWFVGFTGNLVGAVWFGNDDDSPMENMTGGSLPAQTWHDIMEYAHQGIELKPIPGVPATPAVEPTAIPPNGSVAVMGAPNRPVTLSRRSFEAIGSIEDLMRSSGKRSELKPGLNAPSPRSFADANDGRGGYATVGGQIVPR